ncbi:hypothetical protein KI688_007548 [Linnemannia hyalina]|uniref:Uncharacterized protein n=1 Tax=Linnemannia hyalina TaxID=64524 RepID=A0A9P8BMH5_9FUNG|nr:hypothetical protein KI688_007548 [Linnemannia hyalina]
MLDHHQKPLCPRFSKYDRQKLLLLEPTECMPVETEHPDFSADICFSPFVCNEGLVRVRRRDRQQCKEANLKYPISGNSTHDAFHRQFSGPDSFHVVFSGSEKLSPPDWYHAGQCLYVFPFHISNPGRLSLDITHLYDNFGAVVEQAKEWPVLWRKKVVSGLPLEVCRGCPSHVARPRFSSLSEVDEMVVLKTDYAETAAGSEKAGGGQAGTLSNIDRSSLLALGMSSGSSLRTRYQAYTNSRTGPQKYSNLFMDENYDRLPLCSREHAVQASPSPDRLEEKHALTTFSYLHDPLFSHTNEKTDMLVANMGHWATGTKFFDQLMSTSKYHDKLRDLVETIQQHARDLQDLQDEDDGSLGHFLDDEVGGYGGEADDEDGHDYGFVDEGDEDEEELEKEREELRQEELAKESSEELTGEEVYWEDETEEEVDNRRESQEDTKQQHRRPAVQELEDQQEAMDDIEDKYRVDDRQRAESEGYISRNQNNKNHDPMDRTRARYPSNHILRQSKHVKTPAKPKIDVDESEVEEEEEIEEEQERPVVAQNRYRYGTQKKVMLGDNSRLIKAGEDDDAENVKIPSIKKTISSNNKKTTTTAKSRPASDNTPAGKKTTIATKRPASPAFRGSNAYGARKNVPVTTTSKPSSYAASSKRKKTTADTKKVSSSSSSSSNKPKKRYRRAFLDDDYPSLTSPLSKTSSTPSSSSSSSSSSSKMSDSDSLMKTAWVGMVAYPETQQPADSFVSHDWRTIYRLRYWNLIAEDVMTLHNVRFMDFFSMTLSMLDTSPDRAHYYGTDAAEAMLEELAFKLDLCEDKE